MPANWHLIQPEDGCFFFKYKVEASWKYQYIAAHTWVKRQGRNDGKPEGVTTEAVPPESDE